MKKYAHLKDGVVFAHHSTDNHEDLSSENIIEVDVEIDSILNKKYENGQFVDAEIIKYAILDNENKIIDIKKTYFVSEITGPAIVDENVTYLWKWDGTKFNSPELKNEIIPQDLSSTTPKIEVPEADGAPTDTNNNPA